MRTLVAETLGHCQRRGREWAGLTICAGFVAIGLLNGPRDAAAARRFAGSDDWPTFRGNAARTGIAPGSLPDNLKLIWKYEPKLGKLRDSFESSAAIVDQVVYVGSLNGYLLALNANSGELIWSQLLGDGAIKSSPAVSNGVVFVGHEDGTLHARNARDGSAKWSFKTDGEIISSPNVVGDRVLFGSYDSSLYCIAKSDGKLIWQFKTDGYVHCSPAVINGKTFVSGCDGQLRVIDVDTGKEVAAVDMQGQTGASPAVVDRQLYVGHFGNVVLGIDWKKPTVQWQYEHPEKKFPFYSSPAVTTAAVLIGGRDKMLHALDRESGAALWTFATEGKVDSSPVVVGNRVFVGSVDGVLYEVDLATGKERWRFTTGGSLTASPAVSAGKLVIGSEDGVLYCFGSR